MDHKEKMISLKVDQEIISLVDKDRSKVKTSRTSWIIQAIVDRLERMGYEVGE